MTNYETAPAIPDNHDWQGRIVKTPGILAGKPCIRGTRISVELVDELLRGGRIPEDIKRYHFSHISLADMVIVAPPKGAVASRNGRIAPRGCLIKEVER